MEKSGVRRKVVVLGHSGFLGAGIYESFLKDSDYETRGFSSAQIDLSLPESISKLHNFVDRNTSVIMAASVLTKNKDFSSFRKEIDMFINLVDPDLLSKIGHLIYISSTSIYGRSSDSLVTELSLPRSCNLYGLAKFIGELIFKRVCADNNVALTILRPGIIYGRGDFRSPLYRFIESVRMGKDIEVFGDDSTRLFWVHKTDLCRIIKSICRDFKTADYNIVSQENGVSLAELAEAVFNVCGAITGIKFKSGFGVPLNLNFDMSKFRADFVGFEFTKLENGIKDYKEDKE
ncbi:MAG TPA: NAD(P)-dependent oxidoreductase [Candidatus Paceibacterota bacterium]